MFATSRLVDGSIRRSRDAPVGASQMLPEPNARPASTPLVGIGIRPSFEPLRRFNLTTLLGVAIQSESPLASSACGPLTLTAPATRSPTGVSDATEARGDL